MNQQVYDIAKVIHITGISAAAGMCLIDLILVRYFWNRYEQQREESIVIERLIQQLQRITAIGMMLLIVSGVTMMYYLHTVWGAQLWFRIKMGILVLLVVNTLSFRRMLGTRIHTHIVQHANAPWTQQRSLRSRITIVQYIQLTFFIVIFILSVFRFS